MELQSSDVVAGQDATFQQYNDLRADMIDRAFPEYFSLVDSNFNGSTGFNFAARAYSEDIRYFIYSQTNTNVFYVYDSSSGGDSEGRSALSDNSGCTGIGGTAQIGDYLYALLNGGTAPGVYRYDAKDLASGGTLMTGTPTSGVMMCDGTNLWIDAGTSATPYVISGTTLTAGSAVTLTGRAINNGGGMDKLGNFYGIDNTNIVTRYDSSGTLQATSTSKVPNQSGLRFIRYVFNGIPYSQARLAPMINFMRLQLLP